MNQLSGFAGIVLSSGPVGEVPLRDIPGQASSLQCPRLSRPAKCSQLPTGHGLDEAVRATTKLKCYVCRRDPQRRRLIEHSARERARMRQCLAGSRLLTESEVESRHTGRPNGGNGGNPVSCHHFPPGGVPPNGWIYHIKSHYYDLRPGFACYISSPLRILLSFSATLSIFVPELSVRVSDKR